MLGERKRNRAIRKGRKGRGRGKDSWSWKAIPRKRRSREVVVGVMHDSQWKRQPSSWRAGAWNVLTQRSHILQNQGWLPSHLPCFWQDCQMHDITNDNGSGVLFLPYSLFWRHFPFTVDALHLSLWWGFVSPFMDVAVFTTESGGFEPTFLLTQGSLLSIHNYSLCSIRKSFYLLKMFEK